MARLIIIIVLGAIITYGITSLTLNQFTSQGTQNTVDNYSYNIANDIANGMIDIVLMRLANNENYRATSPITEQINGGEVTYTAQNDSLDGEDLIKIVASAKYNGITKTTIVYANVRQLDLEIDPNTRCITANSEIQVNGNFLVDGRNHTSDGVLIPQEGTFALWSTKDIIPSGSMEGAGTADSIDYAPQNPPDPAVIAENQVWAGGFPSKPEELITNFPPGWTLKDVAKSNVNGSQFTTDPELLTFPLSGVTYVELPSGEEWKYADLNGGGILIIHNDDGNAIFKNSGGSFTGLIIGDDVIHLKGDYIGAVISLSASPSGSYAIGNSNGSILYSKEAISNALKEVKFLNYGFGQKRVDVKYWNE